MTWKLTDPENNILTNDLWESFNWDTYIMTLANGKQIQTQPVSDAAQKWAEEYLKILES